jgi:alpha-beta hydrolase superfamily lysophospholipase
MTPESTLSPFVATDGSNLAVQDWPLAPGKAPRALVLLVHGLGEHAGRYAGLAERLNDWGFAVRGYDQYGHGESSGVRGSLPSSTRLLDDLADLVDNARARMAPEVPLILLGHSLGGLVAAHFVALRMRPVQALVLSSPALDPGLSVFQKLLLAVLPKIAPNLRVGNGLDASMLSHDPAVVAAYLGDRLVHDRISGRLARFIADAGPATLALATQWQVPTLLLYAGADKLVNPAGSQAMAASAPPAVLRARCFETLYHELFNELHAAPVFAELKQWLDERFPS